MNDPRNILDHARGIMLEQIMALSGRGHAAPRAFRTQLESESSTQLRGRLEQLTDFPASVEAPQMRIEAKPCVPKSDVRENRSKFPAREISTLQSSLP